MSFEFGCKNVKVKPKSGCPQLVAKGLLSEYQITKYHHEVFQSNNASIYYYGGTLGIGNLQGPVPEFIKQGLSMFYLHPAGDL